MTRTQTYVTLQGYKIRETDKAVQFEIHEVAGDPLESPKKEWFPFSQMKSQTYNKTPGSNDFDTITVTQWIAEQKDLT